MKLFLLFSLSILLSACVSLQPRIGMSFGELNHMTAKSFNGALELVSADGVRSTYRTRRDEGKVYIFEKDVLVKVEQVKSDQIRLQIETIRK
jgi:hypothetical protein